MTSTKEPVLWSRSSVVGLARLGCVHCFGLGWMRLGGTSDEQPCQCVLRAAFRACHKSFQQYAHDEAYRRCGRLASRRGMKRREYVADFVLAARRTLGEDSEHYRLFQWRYLHKLDYVQINRRLGRPARDRYVFHDYNRIETKLGRTFCEVRPFALFPVDAYLGS